MTDIELRFRADFTLTRTWEALGLIAQVLGGSTPVLPLKLASPRPDANGSGRCGKWMWTGGGTILATEITTGDGNPREGFPYQVTHALLCPEGSVTVKRTTLVLEVDQHTFEFAGASAERVMRARTRLHEMLGPGRENPSASYLTRLSEQLVSAGAPELAVPLLRAAVAAAEREDASPALGRRLFALAQAHGVQAPAPIAVELEPLPPLATDHAASLLVVLGDTARIERYVAAGLSDEQKGWFLAEAVREHQDDIVALLIEQADLPAHLVQEGMRKALSAGHAAGLLMLMSAPNAAPHDETALLCSASAFSTPAVISALASMGANVNAVCDSPRPFSEQAFWSGIAIDGYSPLLASIHARRAQNAAALLAAGADPNRLTASHRMPLDAAQQLGDEAMVAALESQGGRHRVDDDLDLVGAVFVGDHALAQLRAERAAPEDFSSAYLAAARGGNERWLRERPRSDRELATRALEAAVEWGHPGSVRLLCLGVDLAALGAGMVRLAAKRNRAGVIALLHEVGADIFAADTHGSTALHVAVESIAMDAVATLASRGADPTLRNGAGESVWDLAHATSHGPIIRRLGMLERSPGDQSVTERELLEEASELIRPYQRFQLLARPAGGPGSWFGGPLSGAGEGTPECSCGEAVQSLAHVDLSALPRAVGRWGEGIVQVLACQSGRHASRREGAGDEPVDPAPLLRIRRYRQDAELSVVQAGDRSLAWRIVDVGAPADDWPMGDGDLPEPTGDEDVDLHTAAQIDSLLREDLTARGDKIGGYARGYRAWLPPACRVCLATLRLVIQLGDDVVQWSYGEATLMLLYQCAEHLDEWAVQFIEGDGRDARWRWRETEAL